MLDSAVNWILSWAPEQAGARKDRIQKTEYRIHREE
jgi:hypothetical protein